MADTVTTTTAEDLVQTEIVNLAVLEALYAESIMLNLVTVTDIAGENTKAAEYPVMPKLSSSGETEGNDMSNTAVATTSNTVTAAEVGIMVTIADLLLQSSPATLEMFASEMGRSGGEKIDTDLTALLAALNSGSAVGTTGNAMTDDILADAVYILELANVSRPFNTVLHPIQYSDLRKDVSSAGGNIFSSSVGNDLARTGRIDELYGAFLFQSSTVPTANTAADRAGGMFNKLALAIAFKWRPRTETQRDASMRGTEIVVTSAYGVGEISDERGVPIVTDA